MQGSGNTYSRLLFSEFRTCDWLPRIPKTPWLVFGSFPQSDCGFGNRRMHLIPLRYYTGVNVSIPVVHRYFTVCKNCLINTDSGAFSVDRLPYCSTLATLPSDLHARNSYSRAVLWKYRRKNNYRQNTLFGYHTLTVNGIIHHELSVTVNHSHRQYGISYRHFLKTKLTEQQNNRGIWLPVTVVVISRSLCVSTIWQLHSESYLELLCWLAVRFTTVPP